MFPFLVFLILAVIILAFTLYVTKQRGSSIGDALKFPDLDGNISPIEPPRVEPPSCLALGIAKSLVDERDMWVEEERDNNSWSALEDYLCIRHSVTKMLLVGCGLPQSSMTTGKQPLPGGFDCIYTVPSLPLGSLSHTDQYYIASTIVAHPIGQYAKRVAKERAAEESKTIAVKHFEKLGCPSKPSV